MIDPLEKHVPTEVVNGFLHEKHILRFLYGVIFAHYIEPDKSMSLSCIRKLSTISIFVNIFRIKMAVLPSQV